MFPLLSDYSRFPRLSKPALEWGAGAAIVIPGQIAP